MHCDAMPNKGRNRALCLAAYEFRCCGAAEKANASVAGAQQTLYIAAVLMYVDTLAATVPSAIVFRVNISHAMTMTLCRFILNVAQLYSATQSRVVRGEGMSIARLGPPWVSWKRERKC